jgi:hypothetical protein
MCQRDPQPAILQTQPRITVADIGDVEAVSAPTQRGHLKPLGLRLKGLGFGVWGLGFGVWGLGFGVWGLVGRFRVSVAIATASRTCSGKAAREAALARFTGRLATTTFFFSTFLFGYGGPVFFFSTFLFGYGCPVFAEKGGTLSWCEWCGGGDVRDRRASASSSRSSKT